MINCTRVRAYAVYHVNKKVAAKRAGDGANLQQNRCHVSCASIHVERSDSKLLSYCRLVTMALTAAVGVLMVFLGCALHFPGEE